jgi:hypothetical protein
VKKIVRVNEWTSNIISMDIHFESAHLLLQEGEGDYPIIDCCWGESDAKSRYYVLFPLSYIGKTSPSS